MHAEMCHIIMCYADIILGCSVTCILVVSSFMYIQALSLPFGDALVTAYRREHSVQFASIKQ